MPAYKVQFTTAKNETWYEPFVVSSDGEAIDLTGATITAQVRDRDGNLVLDLLQSNGRIVVLDAAAGEWALRVEPDDLSGLDSGGYVMDALLETGGVTFNMFKGTVEFIEGVTE